MRPSPPSEMPNYHKQNTVRKKGLILMTWGGKQGKVFRFLFAVSPHFDI